MTPKKCSVSISRLIWRVDKPLRDAHLQQLGHHRLTHLIGAFHAPLMNVKSGEQIRAMISVKNLGKQYNDIVAVSDLSFEVQKGEILGLLGQNGAGKTTVMKIMTGFLEPSSGTILVGGKNVRTDRVSVQKQIGYMPENAPLYDEMLVQEYLLMMVLKFKEL